MFYKIISIYLDYNICIKKDLYNKINFYYWGISMTTDKEKVLKELRKFDNIVFDYWMLQRKAAEDVYHNLLKEIKEEEVSKILEIGENSDIGQIAKDALSISAQKVREDKDIYEMQKQWELENKEKL